ncbi:hypothetical protein JCM3775_007612 [Rhodotorula graminis]|uniref:Uncharacterized protein n=1 Tax=Rhodotorula graminis (strain WP1) TaxID=578459 RepID=A0A0P9ERN0_RHOGW|nr:uncharacterized protein RHOBADRAFT_47219 [Rhodotorula graminis WP1]KPV72036.1 hypothetical protein RHOBADRAFT_47219 [Rhodotorula graminis WP1]
MLETVRSRRIYGAGITLVLPLCAAAGYYLRTSHDDTVTDSAAQLLHKAQPDRQDPQAPLTPAQEVALWKEHAAVEERIRMLRRNELQLDLEHKELDDKLKRIAHRKLANKAA